jgi:uncharacterized protein (TIGR01244 family)
MKLLKRHALLLALLALACPALAQESPIRNFLRVNTEFCTAGQPTVEQLSLLRDDGIRAVLNLRPPAEYDDAEEAARVRELGMEYFNIPVVGSDVQDAQVEEFLALTDENDNQPMFIHCASANRVGAMWLIKRVVRDGWEVEAATAEAEQIGLRSPALREFALGYIERHGN